MNITLSVDEQIVKRARKKLEAVGKSVNEEIREHLAYIAKNDEDVERDIEEFVRLSGQGDSKGWKWNREEVYEDRLRWPRK